METMTLKVEGMACGGCSANVEKRLNKEDGVLDVSASHIKDTAVVSFEPDTVTTSKIIEIIEDAGYEVLLIGDNDQLIA